jgi:hypothetical protein
MGPGWKKNPGNFTVAEGRKLDIADSPEVEVVCQLCDSDGRRILRLLDLMADRLEK